MAFALITRASRHAHASAAVAHPCHTFQFRTLKADLGRVPIILAADVPKLGKRGDSVKVRRGYARNLLVPRRLAVYDTAGSRQALSLPIKPRHSPPHGQRQADDSEGMQSASQALLANRKYLNDALATLSRIDLVFKRPGLPPPIGSLSSEVRVGGRPVTSLTIYKELLDRYHFYNVVRSDSIVMPDGHENGIKSFGEHSVAVGVDVWDSEAQQWQREQASLSVTVQLTDDSDPLVKQRKAEELAAKAAGVVASAEDVAEDVNKDKQKRKK